ncbi:ribosome small subunit-dependent GTPase A [Usitatibacter palustris]|uniref:Small ribosomal subunit biogenesis GTPase RsgA n=1 Tax=Usitatibacter palustris TaxID=2732487 RepID=A0A6M4H4I3_9PROT|nr:ribosome small subunit-dependent GTPase A [Usitatibacter palustris]QJR14531.1 Small ribosomal subunit biogenesis GTPase RsgA [Usitatibacter palustris]
MTTRREREQQVVVEGRVVADFGREFLVELADRRQIVCTRKGKRQDAACGDFVEVKLTGSAQGSIIRVGTRRNLLFRSDEWKEKMLAANVDQVVILVAPKPVFSEAFLNLSLVACEAARIPVVIALNKSDLPEHAATLASLKLYQKIGYLVLSMSAKSDIAPLMPHLEGQLTLLVGQSGVGKSKTVNALVLSDVARVGELTASRETGAHTTTFSRMYRLDKDTVIIDTPGFQSFGLFHLTEDQIGEAMPEFRPFLGTCKFNDCAHRNEPGCKVIEAASRGEIKAERLSFYQVLIEQHRELHESHPDWKK